MVDFVLKNHKKNLTDIEFKNGENLYPHLATKIKKMHNVLKPMKQQFSDFCNFYFLRNGRFSQFLRNLPKYHRNLYSFLPKDVQCSEANEKSIFRFLQFLLFEIW